MSNNRKIKVVGVGGSGSNTVSRMKRSGLKGVELIIINTDAQDINKVKADTKIRIGKKTTQGLGSGMNPEIGRQSAMENYDEISDALKGVDIIFITYGAGGGTGTGAGPVIAEIAKKSGALVIAIVTKPFSFEGKVRTKIAEDGIRELKEKVDALIVISNDKLLSVLDLNVSVLDAFLICDDILRQAVQGISDLINLPGFINIDFADLKSIMTSSGSTLFGIGKAVGQDRIEKAVSAAINSPLLDISMRGAKGILFNVSGGDISLNEIDQAAKIITKEINPEAKVIFGAVQNEKLKKGEIKITVIATGF
jgi:cell division protein FtsZ